MDKTRRKLRDDLGEIADVSKGSSQITYWQRIDGEEFIKVSWMESDEPSLQETFRLCRARGLETQFSFPPGQVAEVLITKSKLIRFKEEPEEKVIKIDNNENA